MATTHVNRDLFGGAIKVDARPDLVDASDLRQIPDNQEVFLYPDCAVSIIVEVLQAVNAATVQDAVKFHFDSLAHDNSAEQSEIRQIDVIFNDRGDSTPSVVVLHGTQSVKKFNSRIPDSIEVLMGLYRIQQKSVDLVATYNVPVVVHSPDGVAVTDTQKENAMKDFDVFVRSLRIVNYGLFA